MSNGCWRCARKVAELTALELSTELVEHYLGLTTSALEQATPLVETGSEDGDRLASMLTMAKDYLGDAEHFRDRGDLLRAYGAANYAHAWIDAAVRIGFLDGHGDDDLFTLP